MNIKCLANVLFVLSLSACAGMQAKGPPFSIHDSVSDDYALLYVYKPDTASQDGVTACLKLLLNEVERGCLWGKGFLKNEIKPGKYTLALQTNAFLGPKLIEFEIELESGASYYLEYGFGKIVPGHALDSKYAGISPIFSGSHSVVSRSEAEALVVLQELYESK